MLRSAAVGRAVVTCCFCGSRSCQGNISGCDNLCFQQRCLSPCQARCRLCQQLACSDSVCKSVKSCFRRETSTESVDFYVDVHACVVDCPRLHAQPSQPRHCSSDAPCCFTSHYSRAVPADGASLPTSACEMKQCRLAKAAAVNCAALRGK